MEIVNQFGRLLLNRLPVYHPKIYRFCRRYVDRYHGENDSNMVTNGELRMLQQLLPECKTVFDVGANMGNWTRMALAINPVLDIHCFEPSKPAFRQLLGQKFPASVTCNNFGLGSSRGQATLFVFGEGAGTNSMYRREGLEAGYDMLPQDQTEIIQLATLDDYFQEAGIQYIDLMKIDVEGHELEVLRGATQLFESGKIDRVQFEYGGCNISARVLLMDLFEWFQQYDYSLHKIYPDRLVKVARYDQRLENFQYQNWLAVRQDSLAMVR